MEIKAGRKKWVKYAHLEPSHVLHLECWTWGRCLHLWAGSLHHEHYTWAPLYPPPLATDHSGSTMGKCSCHSSDYRGHCQIGLYLCDYLLVYVYSICFYYVVVSSQLFYFVYVFILHWFIKGLHRKNLRMCRHIRLNIEINATAIQHRNNARCSKWHRNLQQCMYVHVPILSGHVKVAWVQCNWPSSKHDMSHSVLKFCIWDVIVILQFKKIQLWLLYIYYIS